MYIINNNKQVIVINKLLKAKDISNIIGCGINKAYAIMNSDSFPTITIGRNKYVYEEKFKEWLDSYSYKEFIV